MTVSSRDHSAETHKRNLVISCEVITTIPVVFFFQGLNNDIIFLELDLLETTCHILSPTPLANCTVRSFTQHVST